MDPSTPFYPGLHNLGSRDWTSDERVPWPALGEWQGAREWHDGSPPSQTPRAALVGTADCIESGYPSNLPVVSPVDPLCQQILPPLCYDSQASMFAVTNVLDCLFAQRSAHLIGVRYVSAPAAEILAKNICGATAVTASAGGNLATFPQVTIAQRDGTLVCWVAGTTTYQQFALQAFYAGFGPENIGPFSCSPVYDAAALNILAFLTSQGGASATRIVLVGHSYGGAVCMVMAARMRIANPARKVELLTFGAPKAGDQRLLDLVDELPQTHWANFGDPVPFLPPSGVLFAALLPFIGPILAFFWPKFVRAPRVKVVDVNGKITDYDGNFQPDNVITTATLAIAAGVAAPAFRDHDVNWYAYYICLGCSCVPRPCTPAPPAALNVQLALRNFSYTFGGVTVTNSVGDDFPNPAERATITGYASNGLPNEWEYFPGGGFALHLGATLDGLGRYSTFRLSLSPVPLDPVWLTYWDFPAAQVLAGIDVHTNPTHFEKKIPTDAWHFVFDVVIIPIIL